MVSSPPDQHWQQSLGPYRKIVRMVTKAGELVVDPFVGSGTTGLASGA
jgi:DNA modification methylase